MEVEEFHHRGGMDIEPYNVGECWPSSIRLNVKRKHFSNEESNGRESEVVKVTNKIKKMRLPSSDYVIVRVKTLTGQCIDVEIEPSDPILRIKEVIEEKEGIPPEQQRLIFKGRTMADTNSLKYYQIESGNTIHLVLALRGG